MCKPFLSAGLPYFELNVCWRSGIVGVEVMDRKRVDVVGKEIGFQGRADVVDRESGCQGRGRESTLSEDSRSAIDSL